MKDRHTISSRSLIADVTEIDVIELLAYIKLFAYLYLCKSGAT